MIITIDKSFGKNGWGHVGMFLENLWLSAIHHGLSLCLQESWSIYPKTVKEAINHPDNEIVWCGVAIGYADMNDPINNYRTRREELDSFVKFVK
jgi:nitroreductase